MFKATFNNISVISWRSVLLVEETGEPSCESNPAHYQVYSIQHYVIKFVCDLWQVGCFLRILRFPPPIKDVTEIVLKVALNTMTLTLNGIFLLQLLVLKNVIPEHMVLIVHFIVGVITSRVIVSQVYVSVILGIQDNTVNW